jgi:hypothetical protein
MLAQPRISQAAFSGTPKRRLYFISYEASFVEISITEKGEVQMDANLLQDPPPGVLGEWIEQVAKDAAESYGGDANQLSDTIVKALADT